MYRTRALLKLINKKSYSTKPSPTCNVLEQLKERTLIRISGNEVSEYLQGLITNDIHHLDHGGCMYTMFLNTKGRILYDSIIYKNEESNTFLIECDVAVSESLQKHLKMYRIRRKIDIASLQEEYNIFSLFNLANVKTKTEDTSNDILEKALDGVIVPCDVLNESMPKNTSTTKTHKDLLIYRDPRISLLGSRIITRSDTNIKQQLSEINTFESNPNSAENYRWFRYNLGVGEGIKDLPHGNCFPLECNCDYLHGVSFHKGCYIGQELTARTHHTGVIRKRLMPLVFSTVPTKLADTNNIIYNDVNLGKLRGVEGNAGLGLLRIAQSLEFKRFSVGNGVAQTQKPNWWPVEAPKERLNIQKLE